jgi:hypothetical protein
LIALSRRSVSGGSEAAGISLAAVQSAAPFFVSGLPCTRSDASSGRGPDGFGRALLSRQQDSLQLEQIGTAQHSANIVLRDLAPAFLIERIAAPEEAPDLASRPARQGDVEGFDDDGAALAADFKIQPKQTTLQRNALLLHTP